MKRQQLIMIMTVIILILTGITYGQGKWNEYRGRKGKALEYKEVSDYGLEKNVYKINLAPENIKTTDFIKIIVSEKELPGNRSKDDKVKFFL
ncbi:MAG: hypothetical protein P8078_05825, partial [bacterium]